MRYFLAVLLALAAPVRADDGTRLKLSPEVSLDTGVSPDEALANLFLLPLAYAFYLPHQGFAAFPYQEGVGYGSGPRGVVFAAGSWARRLPGGRGAVHSEFKVRGRERLGWDAAWDAYPAGFFTASRHGNLYSGHVTANYLQTASAVLELGLGAASFQDARTRGGPSGELAFDWFPRRPFTLGWRYQACLLDHQGYHDLSVSAGVSWRWVGLGVGYRAFLNPTRNAFGPELSLRGWF